MLLIMLSACASPLELVEHVIAPPKTGIYGDVAIDTRNGQEILVETEAQKDKRPKKIVNPKDPFEPYHQDIPANVTSSYAHNTDNGYTNAVPQGYVGAQPTPTITAPGQFPDPNQWGIAPSARNSFASPNPFLYALSREYWAIAVYLTNEYQDLNDRALFSQKAENSAGGFAVLPENPKSWNLNERHREQLSVARTYLLNVLEQGGRFATPQLGARAQARFDCWVAEQEKNHHVSASALSCKTEFERTLINIQSVIGAIRNYVPQPPDQSPIERGAQTSLAPIAPSIHEQYIPPSFSNADVPPPTSMGFARESNTKKLSQIAQRSSSPNHRSLYQSATHSYATQKPREYNVYFAFNSAFLNEDAIYKVNQAVDYPFSIPADATVGTSYPFVFTFVDQDDVSTTFNAEVVVGNLI
ncbi:MAG: hypothetical protein AAF403_08105, partial [Pseudomonadota bacterium]